MTNCQYDRSPIVCESNAGSDLLEHWQQRGGTPYNLDCEGEPMDVDSNDGYIHKMPGHWPQQTAMMNIPRPSQELPPRCSSDPNTSTEALNAQVDELLVDWPARRMSSSSCLAAANNRSSSSAINSNDWTSLCTKLQPRVTFSERSSMQVYCPDPTYMKTKSYPKEERKQFGRDALSEAIRIKKLVLRASRPGSSTKDVFKFLLKNNVIGLEEIVGIEHLVLGKSASKLLKERKDHARAVLLEQDRMEQMSRVERQLMQQQQLQEQKQVSTKKISDDSQVDRLGAYAASRSSKAVKRARIRAAMAA